MQVLRVIKGALYFPLAYYFRFFAEIRLKRWRPKIIVVTGSSGKTTLLHLIESQLQRSAKYSHEANSSYGIPFDILGLKRKTLMIGEWPLLLLKAPFGIFKPLPKEKIYVVEVDCDRPGEGKFLASLLRPEVSIWLNSSRTHSMNFDKAVQAKKFSSLEQAIAYEFGYLIQYTSGLVIANGDSKLIVDQVHRTKARSKELIRKRAEQEHLPLSYSRARGEDEEYLEEYEVSQNKTRFRIAGKNFSFNYLLPEDTFYSIRACLALLDYLQISPDYSFAKFILPRGRSSIFKGIKNITIIDSSYNANLDSMRVILDMFSKMPTREKPASAKASAGKWVVLGDMIEQGKTEKEEHEKLAELISKYRFDRIVLMGPRVSKFTYPLLCPVSLMKPKQNLIVEKFLTPTEVLDYLKNNLQGGETVLFKGARFLEGVIEHLLLDKSNVKNLCRQEKVWKIRRRQWGL